MSMLPSETVQAVNRLCDPVCAAISIELKGVYCHHAMGLLFAVGESRFLVTCSHAVLNVVSGGAGLYVPHDETNKLMPLYPKFACLKSSHCDLAVAKLPPDIIDCFSKHRFARAVDVDASTQPVCISCAMAGIVSSESSTWDSSTAKGEPRLAHYAFVSRTTPVQEEIDCIDDRFHFLVAMDQLTTSSETSAGQVSHVTPKKFGGMSGTPVFAINEDPFSPGWVPTDTAIIGIQSSVVKIGNRMVSKVMRIEALRVLLARFFPSDYELMQKLQPFTVSRIRVPSRNNWKSIG